MRQWWVCDESVMSRWWFGDESVMSRWWFGKNQWWISENRWCIDDESVISRWWVGENQWWVSVNWWSWCVNDESVVIRWTSMIMMHRWWIGNESGDELVKINDESVISRWKLMMRRWVGAEMVMSRCLFRNSRISRYQGIIFPLTYLTCHLRWPPLVRVCACFIHFHYHIHYLLFDWSFDVAGQHSNEPLPMSQNLIIWVWMSCTEGWALTATNAYSELAPDSWILCGAG